MLWRVTRAAEDRTLVLVRHARAEHVQGKDDHARELTGRGRRDAAEAGHWLREHAIGCDLVLCSTSSRTLQTCEALAAAGCVEAEVRHERAVYNASPESLLAVVQEADPDADVLMVIGHAPGIPALASMLADGQGSVEAHRAMGEGFPTTALAVLSYSGHWTELGEGSAQLERFHVARG